MQSKFLYLAIIPLLLALSIACSSQQKKDADKPLPRIAIAGIAIESSTFSPAVTHEDAFLARYGDDVFTYYPFLDADSAMRQQANWLPTMRGHAMPGGIVTREAYESLVQQTLERLEQVLPLDGIFLDIHGAMSVVGVDDPEGDFIVRIRKLVGTDVMISTCMDLHGSVSWRLAQNTDLITCFRMAPHEDALISKQRAVENLLQRLESGKEKPPYKAWVPVPILLPGEKTSTRVEPGKSLYAMIEPIVEWEGVTDASIWMSYPWADEPRNHGVVMVYGDHKENVGFAAEKLAQRFWDVRHDFEFVAPTAYLDECLEQALTATDRPFIISDMGDNPTAGGAGDVTWTLQQLLAREEFKTVSGPGLIYASLPDEAFVAEAVRLGVGNTISAYAGARVDDRYAPPVKIAGTIQAIEHGDRRAETEVVVQTGSIKVIVTKKRKPYHYENDFINLGLNPRETDILIVKIGYLVPELYDMRGGWIMALTPGGVDQDLQRLEYKRIMRPMFPLDKDMETPDLKAQFVPLSDEIGN
jgi:microcystin degradation protein MlrC